MAFVNNSFIAAGSLIEFILGSVTKRSSLEYTLLLIKTKPTLANKSSFAVFVTSSATDNILKESTYEFFIFLSLFLRSRKYVCVGRLTVS